jgi:hypothetical protein
MAEQFAKNLPHADELISMRVAFLTTQRFLEAFWERGLKQNDELAMLLSSMEPPPWAIDAPVDAAQWDDFVSARDAVVRGLA